MKQEAGTFRNYISEKVRLLQSFSGGKMVSRWNTDMNLQEVRTLALFIKQLLCENFSPLYSTHVP